MQEAGNKQQKLKIEEKTFFCTITSWKRKERRKRKEVGGAQSTAKPESGSAHFPFFPPFLSPPLLLLALCFCRAVKLHSFDCVGEVPKHCKAHICRARLPILAVCKGISFSLFLCVSPSLPLSSSSHHLLSTIFCSFLSFRISASVSEQLQR